MFNILYWCISSLLILTAAGVGNNAKAEEPAIVLTAEFLQYLAEFGDEQGEILDPEMLSELMRNSQSEVAQKSLESTQENNGLAEELKP